MAVKAATKTAKPKKGGLEDRLDNSGTTALAVRTFQGTDLEQIHAVDWSTMRNPLATLQNMLKWENAQWYYIGSGGDYFSKKEGEGKDAKERWREHAEVWEDFVKDVLGVKKIGYLTESMGYYRWIQKYVVPKGYTKIPPFRTMNFVMQFRDAFEHNRDLIRMVFEEEVYEVPRIRAAVIEKIGVEEYSKKIGQQAPATPKRTRTYGNNHGKNTSAGAQGPSAASPAGLAGRVSGAEIAGSTDRPAYDEHGGRVGAYRGSTAAEITRMAAAGDIIPLENAAKEHTGRLGVLILHYDRFSAAAQDEIKKGIKEIYDKIKK
ncbi:phage tail tape measure protein [Candidatus Woesearchaeota archaeon]|nr:phage tail tape measure protein [Candidatus Woesearchaeota archaeon]